MRKAAGIFLVLVTSFLIHNAHLGIRRSMERTGHKIEVWLDKNSPDRAAEPGRRPGGENPARGKLLQPCSRREACYGTV